MSVSVTGAALYWDRGAKINDYRDMTREQVSKYFESWGAPKEGALSAGVCACVVCMYVCM